MMPAMSRLTQFFKYPLLLSLALLGPVFTLPVLGASATAAVAVVDDLGNHLRLAVPAQRIVSLSPHLTENVFAVGAGAQLVGVTRYSDYPEAARAITRVGDYQAINVEQILSLQPDLILAWVDGGNQRALQRLATMGIPIYWSRPVALGSIGRELSNLARLTGQQTTGQAAAEAFMQGLEQLQPAQLEPPVSVFYQVWDQPLQTLNKDSLIGTLIEHCGGRNIFAQAPAVVAQVAIETVILADPEVILGSHF